MATTDDSTEIIDPDALPTAATPGDEDGVYLSQGGLTKLIPFGVLRALCFPTPAEISGDYTVPNTGVYAIDVDASAGPLTITLPEFSAFDGVQIKFRNVGTSGTFMVQVPSSDSVQIYPPGSSTLATSFNSGLPGTTFTLSWADPTPPKIKGWYSE